MDLTKEEEQILEGRHGETPRKLLEISLKVGEVNGAKRMVEIKSVHSGFIAVYVEGPGSFGTIGIEMLEALAEAGLKFKVPFSTNLIGMELCEWKPMGIPEDFAKTQMRAVRALEQLGAMPGYTCIPYLQENVPRMGDNIAWVESTNVAIANSYFGARSNREVDMTALAAAITGRAPEYGYHLKENRYGDVLIKVNAELDDADLGALGFYVGKTGVQVPVFDGLGKKLSMEQIQRLLAPLSVSGPIALAHIIGVTPEAPSLEAAFDNKKPKETLVIGRKELAEGYDALNTARGRDVDFVMIGCPYCTLEKVKKVAQLLEGKKVRDGVTLWVHTSRNIRAMAEREVGIIEKAGGRVCCDTCTYGTSVKRYYGFKTMATDSAMSAFICQGSPWLGMQTLYGSMEKCVEAAMTGRW